MTDEHIKPWWKSRAIIGALVVIIAQVSRLFDVDVDRESLADAIVSGLTIIGAAMAWFGRVRATRPISLRRVAPGIGHDKLLPIEKRATPVDGATEPVDYKLGEYDDPRGGFKTD